MSIVITPKIKDKSIFNLHYKKIQDEASLLCHILIFKVTNFNLRQLLKYFNSVIDSHIHEKLHCCYLCKASKTSEL